MGQKHTIPSAWDGVNKLGKAAPKLIDAGVMTGTNVLTSDAFNIQNLDNLGLQVKWTGAAVGTFVVQATLDATNATNWVDLVFDPVLLQPNNNATSYLIRLNQVPYPYIRVKYTNASSTGVLNVWISGKDLN